MPPGAVSKGAKWNIDGGALQSSGTTLNDISAGVHTIHFSTIGEYATAPPQTIVVNQNQTTGVVGTYISIDVFNIGKNGKGQVVRRPLKLDGLKVSADSSTATLFKVTGKSLTNFNLKIVENPDNTFNPKTGHLEILSANADSLVALYHHPVYLEDASGLGYDFITLKLEYNDAFDNFDIRLFKIIKPSVLMVHGLWSNGDEGFGVMKKYLMTAGGYPDHQLSLAFYPSDRFFEQNVPVVINEKNALLTVDRMHNISSGKVDVLAHSMGGILSRLYLQSTGYQNDINKLITFNTPHAGSQIADFLLNPKNHYLHNALIKMGKDPTKGAVADLRVKSLAVLNTLNGISKLNKHKVASHAIITVDKTPTVNPVFITYVSNKGWVGFIAASIGLALNDLNKFQQALFDGDEHDLIVAHNSQKGGLASNVKIGGQWHSSTSNTFIKNWALTLLKGSPDNPTLFSKNGYAPPELHSNYFSDEEGEGAPDVLNSSDSIDILYPFPGKTYMAGDTVMLYVSGTNGVTKILSALGSEYIPLANNLIFNNSADVAFLIPKEAIGRLNIVALGYDENGFVNMDTTYIIVGNTANIDSIKIQSELILVPQNRSTSVSVVGYFSDGKVRNISTLPDLSFTFTHHLAEFEVPYYVKGLNTGTDTITATYKGKTDTKPVMVVDSTEWVDIPVDTGAIVGTKIPVAPDEKIDVNVMPNPNSGVFTLRILKELDNFECFISDITGKTLYTKHFKNNREIESEIFRLSPTGGLYFLTLRNSVLAHTQKIIIQQR